MRAYTKTHTQAHIHRIHTKQPLLFQLQSPNYGLEWITHCRKRHCANNFIICSSQRVRNWGDITAFSVAKQGWCVILTSSLIHKWSIAHFLHDAKYLIIMSLYRLSNFKGTVWHFGGRHSLRLRYWCDSLICTWGHRQKLVSLAEHETWRQKGLQTLHL